MAEHRCPIHGPYQTFLIDEGCPKCRAHEERSVRDATEAAKAAERRHRETVQQTERIEEERRRECQDMWERDGREREEREEREQRSSEEAAEHRRAIEDEERRRADSEQARLDAEEDWRQEERERQAQERRFNELRIGLKEFAEDFQIEWRLVNERIEPIQRGILERDGALSTAAATLSSADWQDTSAKEALIRALALEPVPPHLAACSIPGSSDAWRDVVDTTWRLKREPLIHPTLKSELNAVDLPISPNPVAALHLESLLSNLATPIAVPKKDDGTAWRVLGYVCLMGLVWAVVATTGAAIRRTDSVLTLRALLQIGVAVLFVFVFLYKLVIAGRRYDALNQRIIQTRQATSDALRMFRATFRSESDSRDGLEDWIASTVCASSLGAELSTEQARNALQAFATARTHRATCVDRLDRARTERDTFMNQAAPTLAQFGYMEHEVLRVGRDIRQGLRVPGHCISLCRCSKCNGVLSSETRLCPYCGATLR